MRRISAIATILVGVGLVGLGADNGFSQADVPAAPADTSCANAYMAAGASAEQLSQIVQEPAESFTLESEGEALVRAAMWLNGFPEARGALCNVTRLQSLQKVQLSLNARIKFLEDTARPSMEKDVPAKIEEAINSAKKWLTKTP